MIVLGIDQGIANFGYSILSIDESKTTLIEYGCFTSSPNGNQQVRIYNLINKVEELIKKYNPCAICHERLFFSPPKKNGRKKSASILNTNMITGVIWYIAGKYKINVFQYSPQSVKKVLCKNGRADKVDVIKVIESRFEINCLKTHKEHICDAIAIGLMQETQTYDT